MDFLKSLKDFIVANPMHSAIIAGAAFVLGLILG
jgi:hypothetical protein